MDDRKVKLTLGFSGDTKEVELEIPADEPTPWDRNSKLTYVGKAHPKVDARQKVTGAAKYTHDLNLPGMLYGGFIRCPYAKAKITDLDLSAVEAHPEVKAVMRMSLRDGTTDYAHQAVAALAAETRQGLEEAIRLAKLQFEKLPHAARLDQAMAEGAPAVHGNRPNVERGAPGRNAEQVEALFAKGDLKVVEAEARTQVQTHSCLETHGSVAQWDGDKLTLWTSTQATFGVRGQLSQALSRAGSDVPESNITVISEFMGGGFGSKFMAGYWSVAAATLAKDAGRPVKMMLDRREEQTDTGNRPDSIQVMKAGVNGDGRIAAYDVTNLGTPGVSRGAGVRNPMVYDFGESAARNGEVATNAGGQQAMRAPGHPQGAFGVETIMDLAAEAAGVDPLEFRIRHNRNPVREAQFREGAERIGWAARQANGAATGRYRVGYGVAAATWPSTGGPAAEILCRITQDGAVEVRSGAQDLGVGTRTLLAIIAGEELGIPPAEIRTAIGNTNDPPGPGSGGSRTAPSIGPAVRQAAFLAGRDLRALVATELGCTADDLVCQGGEIRHTTDASKRIPFRDACRLIRQGPLTATGKRRRNYGREATYRNDVAGAQFAKVTVDVDFGIVRVDKVVALQDAGIIINRATAEGQVLGGVIQGLSYALFEERHMDRHLGHMINGDLEMYKIAGPKDMPEVEVILYDVANGGNNCSMAGIGEPTCIPTAAAIAGAVHNALGVRVLALPMTPDRVLAALEKGGR